jgi:hypothetical protein
MAPEEAKKQDTGQERQGSNADGTGAELRGTKVTVDAEQARGREAQEAGLPLPKAGEHGIGAAGASGQADRKDSAGRTGKTDEERKTSGVSGQDLAGDGLPPA